MSDKAFRKALGADHSLVQAVDTWTRIKQDPWFQAHGHPNKWREEVDRPFRNGIRLIMSARRADGHEPLTPCLRQLWEDHKGLRRESARVRKEFLGLSRLGWVLPYWTRGRGGDGVMPRERHAHETRVRLVGGDVLDTTAGKDLIDHRTGDKTSIKVRTEFPPPPGPPVRYGPRVLGRPEASSGHGHATGASERRSLRTDEQPRRPGDSEGQAEDPGAEAASKPPPVALFVPVTVPHVTPGRTLFSVVVEKLLDALDLWHGPDDEAKRLRIASHLPDVLTEFGDSRPGQRLAATIANIVQRR